MSEPAIRRASPCDAEALAAIGADTFVETFGHMYPPQDLEAYLAEAYDVAKTRRDLEDPNQAAWLVEADGQVIGYAQVGPCGLPHPQATPAFGELKRIYFKRGWQGRGVGKALFAEAMAWLQKDGPREVWIGVWSENYGAQRFYGREGFVKIGEYGFKVGGTVDHEFILRRSKESFAVRATNTVEPAHNIA